MVDYVDSCRWSSACLCVLWSYNKGWSNGIIISYIYPLYTLPHGTPTWDNFRGAETRNNMNPVWEDMKWDEKSSDEMSWDEVQVWSASVKCEECSVKCEESACLALMRRSCFWTTTLQQHSFAQSTHARAWLAHGACKFLDSSTGKWFMKA